MIWPMFISGWKIINQQGASAPVFVLWLFVHNIVVNHKPTPLKAVFTSLFFFVSFFVSAQSFYVEPTEKGFENELSRKLDFEGVKIAPTKDAADYILSIHYQKNKRNYKFEGYIKASDKSGTELYRSKVVSKAANAFNGYQAMPAIITTIAEKDLLPAIKKGF